MTIDLDDLRAAMIAATPDADDDLKARNISRAEEIFARSQESRPGARPNSDHPKNSGLIRGTRKMLNSISTKGFLTATTSLAALGLVTFIILPQGGDLTRLQGSGSQNVDLNGTTSSATGIDKSETNIAGVDRPTEETAQDNEMPADLITPKPATERDGIVLAEPINPSFTARTVEAETFADSAAGQARTRSIRGGSDVLSIAPSPEIGGQLIQLETNTEEYANAAENSLKIVSDEPVSTFSIDVDTASYSVVRSSLSGGYLPNPDAVRIEEMVNYFPYSYTAPDGEYPFQQTVTVTQTPWNTGTQLVHIGIQGDLPELDSRPPLNLVFLIDTSGSMQGANKLPLLIQSFRLMLSELRPQDEISIVTYAGSAGQVLEPTPASERSTILAALERLSAGGSTAGQAGLQQAYAVAESMAEDNEISRVILATDGDFNVGLSDPDALKSYIETKRDSGTYLSVLGFGRGNLDDATMQALAQNGNGTAAYIDTLNEAQKVLVDQLSGAMFPIANDVKIQVEFNPAQIAEYRLIGYETRALRREDFNNDQIDAGEIGAGHTVTAIYEVTPVGSDAILTDALRYGEAPQPNSSGELGFLKMRYKTPGQNESVLIETPISADVGQISDDVQFAISVAGFGQLLRGSDYLGEWSYQNAIDLATSAKGGDPFGYRAEAVSLMRLAESLSAN